MRCVAAWSRTPGNVIRGRALIVAGTDLTTFAVAIPAVLYAGISKGGFGSGAAFAAAPFLALFLDPAVAVGMMLPLLMLMDVTAIPAYWRKWDRADAVRLIAGAVPGVLVGAALWRVANDDVIRLLIGVVALGFVAYRVADARGWLRLATGRWPDGAGYFWGGVAGFTSFISHAGGPPAAIYLLGRDVDKTRYQATSVLVFWAINLMKAAPYFALGIFSATSFMLDLLLAPVAVVGVLIGVRLHHLVSQQLFFRLTYTVLILSGAKLIAEALV